MANCVYCGVWTGEGKSDHRESCGAPECERYIREQDALEREEAHRRLDEDLGYWRSRIGLATRPRNC